VTYIDTARTALEARCPGQDPAILDLYLLLALIKGAEVTLRDVHDAWAVWRSRSRPGHPSIVPFEQLTPDVQDLDRPFADAIASAAPDEEYAR
jgi:hypothetical protein